MIDTIRHHNGTILVGDCRDGMRTLPDRSVHCCVTSPPYWGLRDYGVDGQIGLEKSMDEFLSKMVDVFRDVWRVLRDDGVAWVNMGDSYNAGRNGGHAGGPKQASLPRHNGIERSGANVPGLKPKDLCGIPWRLAFALQADGWYLRQDVIWHKPNPMPESISDRCTKSHEYVFLLTKSARYWYDAEGIKEDREGETHSRGTKRSPPIESAGIGHKDWCKYMTQDDELTSRNKRSVWTVPTYSYPGAHFATYPPKLIEPCIIAGCPEQCCPACGMGWERLTEKTKVRTRPGKNSKSYDRTTGEVTDDGIEKPWRDRAEIGNRDPGRHVTETKTLGWEPACKCGETTSVPGVVLDPFGGSGTTGEVAMGLGRRFVLCELNPEYAGLIEDRLRQPTLF